MASHVHNSDLFNEIEINLLKAAKLLINYCKKLFTAEIASSVCFTVSLKTE